MALVFPRGIIAVPPAPRTTGGLATRRSWCADATSAFLPPSLAGQGIQRSGALSGIADRRPVPSPWGTARRWRVPRPVGASYPRFVAVASYATALGADIAVDALGSST